MLMIARMIKKSAGLANQIGSGNAGKRCRLIIVRGVA
jgi:hypothetical protein